MRTLVLSGTILLAATASAAANDPVGEWLVKDGSARIKVVSCPPALWGVISAEVNPGRDTANPDPTQRNRPMMGIPILINMKQTEPNLWSGKIYDARGGSLYDAKLSVNRNDMLEVRGCVASIFCGGEDWKRITNPNTPPLPPSAAAPASPVKGSGAMAQSPSKAAPPPAPRAQQAAQQTKGVAPAAGPPLDPVCSNVSGLVPRQ